MRKSSSIILLFAWFSTQITFGQTPVAYAGPDQDFCVGDTVQLQGTGSNAGPTYTYQWSPNAFISDPTISNPQAWPPTPTDYTLVVTSNSLTSAPDTVRITAHPIPTVTTGPSQDICFGDTAQLKAHASGDPLAVYTYQWTPSASLNNPTLENPKAFPLQSTTYSVTVQSLWGCQSSADSMALFIQPTPFAQAGANQIVCLGDSFLLEGGYAWSTADTLPASLVNHQWSPAALVGNPGELSTMALADSSGWYSLQVSAGVCSRTDSVFISAFPQPMPVIMQSGLELLANGGLGGASYQWFLNNVPIPNANGGIYTVTQPGCYSVMVSEGSCVGISDTVCIQSVGVPEPRGWKNLQVFPNPFQENLLVVFDLGQGSVIGWELLDVNGRVVAEEASQKYRRGSVSLHIPGEKLVPGYYLLRVRSDQEKLTIPVVRIPGR